MTFHHQNPNYVYSGSFDSLLRKYDIEYNTLTLSYQKECAPILSIDQYGSYVASGHLGGILNVFDETSGKHIFGFKLPYDILKVSFNTPSSNSTSNNGPIRAPTLSTTETAPMLSVCYQDGSIGLFDLRKF